MSNQRLVIGQTKRHPQNHRALAMLERAYHQRYPRIWQLKLDQRYETLRSDPRFKDLLRRVGMPE